MEGAETKVLDGGRETLSSAQPTLMLEVHEPDAVAAIGGSWEEIYAILADSYDDPTVRRIWDPTDERTEQADVELAPPDRRESHRLVISEP